MYILVSLILKTYSKVLSKIDMVKDFGKLPCSLRSYTTEIDLQELFIDLTSKSTNFTEKYLNLNKEIVDVVEAYSLVSFYPLDINDKELVNNLVCMMDNANGFFYYLVVLS